MRLYRGLKQPYRPDAEPAGSDRGADFTDCAYTALQFASGRHGVVLVLDVTESSNPHVRQELWRREGARRFVVWGGFDGLIAGIIPAKELRTRLRQRGTSSLCDADKAMILEWFIREALTPPSVHDAQHAQVR